LPSLPRLNVATPEFFKGINAEIEKEDFSIWKTYLRWHLIHANARHLSSAFGNADFDFYEKTLQGVQEIEPRWKRCTEDVDDDLGEALGQAYVEKYFGPEAKQQAVRMVKEIESAMEADINTL
jgi:predicted metalloendopeptidase